VFKFFNIEYFWLLGLIPVMIVALVLFLRWRKNALQRYGDPKIFAPLMPEASVGKTILKFILLSLTLAAVVLALARPKTGSRIEKVQRKGIDIMLCLDVSNSMMAEDIRPNRLERAKQSVARLIDRLSGDRIGIIIFAGKAYTQLPITTDYAAAKLFLNTVNTGIIPSQGTAIADAIELAASSFGETKHNKAIIVITDGEDHEGKALEQTEAAAKNGILVYTIGMGLPEGAPIPVYKGGNITGYKKDREGNTVISKLDETLLQRIASLGNGMYVRASNSEAGLNKVFEDLNKVEKSEIESTQYADHEDQFQYFTALALLLLLIDLVVFERKTIWLRRLKPFGHFSSGMPTKVLLLLGFLMPVLAIGQKENSLLRQGNRQYEQGNYSEAEKDYRRALELNQGSVKGQFNLGTAVYQGKNYGESTRIYENLAGGKHDAATQAKIWHNLGNSLLEEKQYEKSINAYKNALLNNPSDADSKYNLEYARMMLRKQQQQQQQNQDKQKDDQQKQDQQKQDQQKQDEQKQQQPQDQKKLSKEDAERMLEALKNEEKKTMDKVKKQQAKVQVVGVEKDW